MFCLLIQKILRSVNKDGTYTNKSTIYSVTLLSAFLFLIKQYQVKSLDANFGF